MKISIAIEMQHEFQNFTFDTAYLPRCTVLNVQIKWYRTRYHAVSYRNELFQWTLCCLFILINKIWSKSLAKSPLPSIYVYRCYYLFFVIKLLLLVRYVLKWFGYWQGDYFQITYEYRKLCKSSMNCFSALDEMIM